MKKPAATKLRKIAAGPVVPSSSITLPQSLGIVESRRLVGIIRQQYPLIALTIETLRPPVGVEDLSMPPQGSRSSLFLGLSLARTSQTYPATTLYSVPSIEGFDVQGNGQGFGYHGHRWQACTRLNA
jgi:hypothetical protein